MTSNLDGSTRGLAENIALEVGNTGLEREVGSTVLEGENAGLKVVSIEQGVVSTVQEVESTAVEGNIVAE